MNKISRFALVGILFLGCAMNTLTQPNAKSANKLADSKFVLADEGTSNGRSGLDRKVTEEFVIGTGDVLAINVWKESAISRVVPVRSDGRISLPLIDEIQAGGRTPKQLPKQLETEITAKLKDYVSEPEVTVIVQEIRSQKFNVLGEAISQRMRDASAIKRLLMRQTPPRLIF